MFCCIKAIDCLASDCRSLSTFPITHSAQLSASWLYFTVRPQVTGCYGASANLLHRFCCCTAADLSEVLHAAQYTALIALPSMLRVADPKSGLGVWINSPSSCCVLKRLQKFLIWLVQGRLQPTTESDCKALTMLLQSWHDSALISNIAYPQRDSSRGLQGCRIHQMSAQYLTVAAMIGFPTLLSRPIT